MVVEFAIRAGQLLTGPLFSEPMRRLVAPPGSGITLRDEGQLFLAELKRNRFGFISF